MSGPSRLIIVLVGPLVPALVLHFFLRGKDWYLRYGGPLGTYIALTTLLLQLLPSGPKPSPVPPPHEAEVTVQLWPEPRISKKFLQERDARLYLRYGDMRADFTEFVSTQDYLEQTKLVDADLIDKPAQAIVSPRDKYQLRPGARFVRKFLRLEVLQARGEPPPVVRRQGPGGQEFLATTSVPVYTDAALFSGPLAHQGVVWKSEPGTAYLLTLEGPNMDLRSRVKIVNPAGTTLDGAWVGNEVGASNGIPVEVSTDGRLLRVYAGFSQVPPKGAPLSLQVTNPDGRTYSLPISVVSPAARPATARP